MHHWKLVSCKTDLISYFILITLENVQTVSFQKFWEFAFDNYAGDAIYCDIHFYLVVEQSVVLSHMMILVISVLIEKYAIGSFSEKR